MENLQQMFWKDKFDGDIVHFGYRWPMRGLPGRYHQRHAFTCHIDDVDSMFGDAVQARVKELGPGGVDCIYVSAELTEDAA